MISHNHYDVGKQTYHKIMVLSGEEREQKTKLEGVMWKATVNIPWQWTQVTISLDMGLMII